jgi:capsular polysaccharide transport system permease protein
MTTARISLQRLAEAADGHRRIIWALLMRELATRYGRSNIGFLWLIAEPLVFAGLVSLLWRTIKAPYEYGIPVVPFVVTGYLPLILFRQSVNYSVGAVTVNQDLLYHRQITPLHLFIGRAFVEFIGVTLAFCVIVTGLNLVGLMNPPQDVLMVYGGWLLLSWIVFGVSTIVGALAEIFEFMDKFVSVATYIMVPLSGAFFMVSWLPPRYREIVLFLPFIHCFELIRRGFFGEFITAYYNIPYAVVWAAGLTLVGLWLVQFVRSRVEVH